MDVSQPFAEHLLYSLLYLSTNIAQCAGRMSCELRYRPRSPWSLCGSVVEHRSEESEGLRFDSSWELRIFSLSHARDNNKTSFLISYIANVLLLCRSYKL